MLELDEDPGLELVEPNPDGVVEILEDPVVVEPDPVEIVVPLEDPDETVEPLGDPELDPVDTVEPDDEPDEIVEPLEVPELPDDTVEQVVYVNSHTGRLDAVQSYPVKLEGSELLLMAKQFPADSPPFIQSIPDHKG